MSRCPPAAELAGFLSGQLDLGALLRKMGHPNEAAPAFRTALELRDQLTREHPTVAEYAAELGNSCVGYGNLIRDSGKPAEAVEWYDKAVTTLHPAVQREPRLVAARSYLCRACQGRAAALDQLGRHTAAAHDWEQAATLDADKNRFGHRCRQALSLASAGDHETAARLAEELAKAAAPDAVYQLARIFARAAGAAREDRERAESYADRSVALLQRARDEGAFGDKAQRETLAKDADFALLAARADFRALLAHLEQPGAKQ